MKRKTHDTQALKRRFLAKMELLNATLRTTRDQVGIPRAGFKRARTYQAWEDKEASKRKLAPLLSKIMRKAHLSPKWRNTLRQYIVHGEPYGWPTVGGTRIVNHNGEPALLLDPGIGIKDIKADWKTIEKTARWLRKYSGVPAMKRYREPAFFDNYEKAYRMKMGGLSNKQIAEQMGTDYVKVAEMIKRYLAWVKEPI